MIVGVLACSKRKLARPAPALDLYTGDVFRLSLAWLRTQGATRIVVLSALHGAVDGAEVLEPYERSLAAQPSDVRAHWARIARSRVALLVPPGATVLAIVPALYLPALRDTPHARHFGGLPIGRLRQALGTALGAVA